MSNSGTTISQPVNIAADVYKVLGISAKGGVYDTGYACSNDHGQIKIFNKYKPITASTVGIVTSEDRKKANHNLQLSEAKYLDAKIQGYDKWTYIKPTPPYRITDFVNTDEAGYYGYNHNAVAPLQMDQNVVVWNTASQSGCPMIIPSYKYTRNQMQGTTANMELYLSEFTDKNNNGAELGGYVIAVACVVRNILYVANSFNNIARSLSTDLCTIDINQFSAFANAIDDETVTDLYPVINPFTPTTYKGVYTGLSTSGTNGYNNGRFIPFPEAPVMKLVKTSIQTISLDPAGGNVKIRNTNKSTGVMLGEITIPFVAGQPNQSTLPQVPSGMVPVSSDSATSIMEITVTLNNTKSRTKVVGGVSVSASPVTTTINVDDIHIAYVSYMDTSYGGGAGKVVCQVMQDLSSGNGQTTREITIEAGKSKKVMLQFSFQRGWGVGFTSGAPYLGLVYSLYINSTSEALAIDTQGTYYFRT